MFTIDPTIEAGDIVGGSIAALGLIAAMFTFVLQERKSNRLHKIEIYQSLEFASNAVFAFEAENSALMEKFRDLEPKKEKFEEHSWEALMKFAVIEDGTFTPTGELSEAYERLEPEIRVVRKYYEQTLNLFEVAARFRHDGIVEAKVFGSWVIWYYETCQEWAFRWMWPAMRKNYLSQLREVFDFPVQFFDFGESQTPEGRNKLESDFFTNVAQVIRCKVIAKWRDIAEKEKADLKEKKKPTYAKKWWFGEKPVMIQDKFGDRSGLLPPYKSDSSGQSVEKIQRHLDTTEITWVHDAEVRVEAARFFYATISGDDAYISHSEIQMGLSPDGKTWASNLEKLFLEDMGNFGEGQELAVMRNTAGCMLAAAIVQWVSTDRVSFCVLEDLAVDTAERSSGIGGKMVDWIEGEARRRGSRWIFLESGKNNHRAHQFFERHGFEKMSSVFAKLLD